MVRSKKIIGLVLFAISVIGASSCEVQKPMYTAIYLDNNPAVESTVIDSAELETIELAPEIEIDSFATIVPSSSKDLLQHKQTRKNQKSMLDTNSAEQSILEEKIGEPETKVLTALDTLNNKKEESNPEKLIQTKEVPVPIKQELSEVDTSSLSVKESNTLQKRVGITDTVYKVKEVVKIVSIPNTEKDHETNTKLKSKSDSLDLLNDQISDLKKQKAAVPETIYKEKEVIKVVPVVITEKDPKEAAKLQVKSDSLALLQNQIKELEQQKLRTPDTVYKENPGPKLVLPDPNKVNSQDSIKQAVRLQEKSDSLRMLQKQINSSQIKQEGNSDTVYIEKEVIKTVPVLNSEKEKEALARLAVQNDSLTLLKKRINDSQNEKETKADTIYLVKEVIKSVPVETNKVSNLDSILITAYYRMGKVTPIGGDSIFTILKNIIRTQKVQKITISGYTDISGDLYVNKMITAKRISYFLQNIAVVFPVEKIFSQNFGNTFASEEVIDNERRLVFSVLISK